MVDVVTDILRVLFLFPLQAKSSFPISIMYLFAPITHCCLYHSLPCCKLKYATYRYLVIYDNLS